MAVFSQPTMIIVMGVSGSGKSTVGSELAKKLNVDFLDADDVHPQANIDKMAAGTPLGDQDREPWLRRVRQEGLALLQVHSTAARQVGAPNAVVVACSALKSSYRRILRGKEADDPSQVSLPQQHDPHFRVCFVYLKGPETLIKERIQLRKHHFLGPHMLRSQLETLEEPDLAAEADDHTLFVPIPLLTNGTQPKPCDHLVEEILHHLTQCDGGEPTGPLPPLDHLLGPEGADTLKQSLASLFEPSESMHRKLIPSLQQHHKLQPLLTYVDLIKCSQGIIQSEFALEDKVDFLGSHPRIGQVHSLSKQSSREQRNHEPTDPDVLSKLEELNEEYEARYPGLRYVTFVNGRSRKEIVAEMESCLRGPDPKAPPGPGKHERGGTWENELAKGLQAVCDIAMSRVCSLGKP